MTKTKADKADIWMPFYVGDYLADTMHLSAAEHGGYLMLILHYWKSGPIPDDDAQLAIITRLGDAWSNASSKLRAFFEHRDGMLVHDRIDREKITARSNNDKNKARATAAAEKRWGKNATSNAPSNPQAVLNECPSPSPSPSKKPKPSCAIALDGFALTGGDGEPEEPKIDPHFLRAWERYPKRHGGNSRADALIAWKARLRAGATVDEMIAGVERYAMHLKLEGKIGTPYVMQGATFFGPGERYKEDWPASASKAVSQTQSRHSGFEDIDYNEGIEDGRIT